MPSNPTRISYFQEIPLKYTQILSGNKFLIYDSLFNDNEETNCGRILIFASTENLVQLFKCEIWFVDGTFKTSPSLLYQLYSVLATQIGVNRKLLTVGLPFVHALLENKQRASYERVFNVILKEGSKLGFTTLPKCIKTDFQLSIIKAAGTVFGRDTVKCCFFHLCQSVYRHVVNEGLQTQYNDSDDRRIKVGSHMLCALAFVPTDEVENYFKLLRDELPEELEPITDYF